MSPYLAILVTNCLWASYIYLYFLQNWGSKSIGVKNSSTKIGKYAASLQTNNQQFSQSGNVINSTVQSSSYHNLQPTGTEQSPLIDCIPGVQITELQQQTSQSSVTKPGCKHYQWMIVLPTKRKQVSLKQSPIAHVKQ